LNKISHLLHSYTEWIKAVLVPLGPWGMLAFAAVDGSILGMPLDAIFVGYVYHDRSRFLLYVLLGALGSALGSMVIYGIGYAGGEVLLRKKLSPERFEKIHASFDKHEFWALMLPSMLPPPTPFKVFVLAAAAFEMRWARFLLAIFAGRFLRFLIEALLTLWLGPGIVALTGNLVTHHFLWIVAIVGEIAAAWIVWRLVTRKKNAAGNDKSTLRGEETSVR
jgi:membrane protein YqaA with SNARE-associated domain